MFSFLRTLLDEIVKLRVEIAFQRMDIQELNKNVKKAVEALENSKESTQHIQRLLSNATGPSSKGSVFFRTRGKYD